MKLNLGPKGIPTAKEMRQLEQLAANLQQVANAKFRSGDHVKFIGPFDDVREYLHGVVNKNIHMGHDGKMVYGVKVGKTQYYILPNFLQADRPSARKFSSKAKQPVQLTEKSTMKNRKQVQVSEAAANTRVLKRTKRLMKLEVVGVKFAGAEHKVRFIANAIKNVVIARCKGQKPMRITLADSGKFAVRVRGDQMVLAAPTPQQAFAKGVRGFWA
jgi:hypothetical protein